MNNINEIINNVQNNPSASATASTLLTMIFGFVIRLIELKHMRKCGKLKDE
jgi:hypothetical protein